MNENMTREQIEAEIRAVDQLMKANDYIGTKIAMAEPQRKSMQRKLQNQRNWLKEKMSLRQCWRI